MHASALIPIISLIAATGWTAGEPPAKPTFSVDAEGARVTCGSKGLTLRRHFGQLRLVLDSAVQCHAEVMQDFGQGPIGSVFFLEKEFSTQGTEAIFTAKPRMKRADQEPLGEFSFRMELLKDGWVRLTSVTRMKPEHTVEDQYFFMNLPDFMPLTGTVRLAGRTVEMGDKTYLSIGEKEFGGARISLYPDHPCSSLEILLDEGSTAAVNKRRIGIRPKNGRLSFRIDLRGETVRQRSDQFYSGVDFWNLDRLRLPDYRARRNLLPNPSFEAGTRYYNYPIWGTLPWRVRPRLVLYEVDGAQARFGAHSLKMTVDRNRASMALGTFALPLERGAKYALSFYAKGSLDRGLRVHLWGRGQPAALWGNRPNHPTFNVVGEWKRYTFDFVSLLNFGCLFFEGRLLGDSQADEATIWLDGIQLERGQVTDYVEPPVAAQLLSAERGNFLRFGQDPELRMALRSAPNVRIAATLDVRDFFGRGVFRQSLKLRTDPKGDAEIRLLELDRIIRARQQRGIFPVSCEFTSPAFEKPFREFFRFSVMSFLDNTHKNKTLVQHGYRITPQLAGAGMDRFLARERAVGVGACCQVGPEESSVAVDKERSELVAAHGIEQLGRPVVVKRHGPHGHGKIVGDDGRVVMDNIKTRVNVTDEELAQFESICALKAARRPWVKQWYFAAECRAGLKPLSDDLDSFCKFLLATLRGIKKGNPKARVLITGGPWNMSPGLGVKWLESYIRKTRELDTHARFDGCAIHIYRRQPENPDLDAETAALLAMLDRNGVGDWPVYWNEGLNYFEYNLPILGATPYQGNSVKNFHGTLSYDLGRAERISVALRARSWLVALKYHDRVKAVRDFAGEQRMYLDHDLAAGAAQKVINTLGRVLGNATFHRDIRFAPECRCYVFIDEADRPVAVIWGHNGFVDRWKRAAPKFSFDFSHAQSRILDLMENDRTPLRDADGRSILSVGSFPVFVIGPAGTADTLCRAIADARPVSAFAGTVAVSAHPEPNGTARVIFKNLISREVRGQARITLNGTQLTHPLTLAPLAEERRSLRLAIPAKPGPPLLPFDFECALKGRVTAIANPYLLLAANSGAKIVVDGQPNDWRGRPAAALGNDATVRFAIANGTLYLAVETTDDRPNALTGLGVYIDPIVAPATWSQPKAPIDNVFVYELQSRRTASDGLIAHRWHAPGVQADSGSAPRAREHAGQVVLKRVIRPQGSFIEIAFPPHSFMPLRLKAGSRFGLNVSLPGRAGKTAMMVAWNGYEDLEHAGHIRFAMALVTK